jgi:hypothetical protein
MKAYFDRTEPYYFAREPQFDGNPVEVPERILDVLDGRKRTLLLMEEAIENAGAPEDSAQNLTDYFVDLLEAELSIDVPEIVTVEGAIADGNE